MKPPKRGAPTKPPEERKGSPIQLRLTDAEREVCAKAAERADKKMSAWARDVLVRAARRTQ